MKTILISLTLVGLLLFAGAREAEAARVRGYSRGNGTYVQPHYRSNPNSFKWDNWSSRGNINPWNVKEDTIGGGNEKFVHWDTRHWRVDKRSGSRSA